MDAGPAGFVLYYTNANSGAVFCINFLAIIPNTGVMGFAVEEMNTHVGSAVRGLLGATTGNAVQLISSVLLLKSRQTVVLKASFIGTILSNALLMTGLAFFMGGLRRIEQHFNVAVTHTISSVLLLASLGITLPTATSLLVANTATKDILATSRAVAMLLITSYAGWLIFQLKTHAVMIGEPSKKVEERTMELKPGATNRGVAAIGASAAGAVGGRIHQNNILANNDDDDDNDNVKLVAVLTRLGSVIAMVSSGVLIGFHSEFATNSIQGLCQQADLPPTFVGFLIFPIISYDVGSISLALKDDMGSSLALTLERCMQTAMLVMPFTVLLAWCIGIDEMNLDLGGFLAVSLFSSTLIITYFVQQGKLLDGFNECGLA